MGDPTRQRYCYYDNGGGNWYVTAMPAALAPYLGTPTVRDDSWQNVDADIQAPGPVHDAFVCPSDSCTIDQTYSPPQWVKNPGTGSYLNGWSSYGFNEELFGWTDKNVNGTAGHSRARGKLASIPHSSETMMICDTNPNTPNGNIGVWLLGPNLSLGDVYLGTGGSVSNAIFDLVRHRGTMNILFVDGHVESLPILSTGKTAGSGAVGSPDNSPSGALMNVSMDKDFR